MGKYWEAAFNITRSGNRSVNCQRTGLFVIYRTYPWSILVVVDVNKGVEQTTVVLVDGR